MKKMQMLQQIVALVLFSMVASSVGQRYDYGTVKLVLQWPIAYCNVRGICCKSPVPHAFKIHGLWHFKGSEIRTNCIPCHPLRPHHLTKNLNTRLRQAWPSLNLNGKDFQFWSHEWEKHGSCHHVGDPANYFQTALNLYSRYADVLPIISGSLSDEHKGYTPQEIVGIITKVTQRIPELRCSIDKYGRNQLYEIVLCFYPDKKHNIKDCRKNKFSQCHPSNIMFPSAQSFYSHNGQEVDTVRNQPQKSKNDEL
ncbi:hypothetical protein Patl1_21900 [Pistacia atlantica]|uniref:Uncharacterized protein n=1 Tax=Pistacia atlantica TaxID=434234 RepID=A0ACC1BKD6_9ROSI|nr:hypothetical protein Patl1_21900 [Pistacia atlantica]